MWGPTQRPAINHSADHLDGGGKRDREGGGTGREERQGGERDREGREAGRAEG